MSLLPVKVEDIWTCSENLGEDLILAGAGIDDIEPLELDGLQDEMLASTDTRLILDEVKLPWETGGFGKRVSAPSSDRSSVGKEKWNAVKIGEYGMRRVSDITGSRAIKKPSRKIETQSVKIDWKERVEENERGDGPPRLFQTTLEEAFCRRVKVRVKPKDALKAEMKRRNVLRERQTEQTPRSQDRCP